MSRPYSFLLNKKYLLIAVISVLCLAGVYRGAETYLAKVRVPPEERLTVALDKTINSSAFRFRMAVKIGDDTISKVEGERVAPDGVHIKGTMQDLPVEFIHTGDKTYVKGYWSDRWTCLEGNKMAESELFITEFNPLGNFNFKDIPVVKEIKDKKTKLKVLEFSPIVQNSLMELNYDNYFYRVWVDPKQQVITKALIQAQGKIKDNNKLEINLEIWDHNNKQIKIEQPDV